MRVAVVGVGAVGGYFGARLAQAGQEVHFLARSARVAAMRERGLRIQSVFGYFELAPAAIRATDAPSEIGPVDVVLFTVKSYDTDAAAASLGPLIGPDTAVISLQNGIDNEERLSREVGTDHVVGGVAYILAEAREPGLVVHTGGPTRIVVGELHRTSRERVDAFAAACAAAGFPADVSADIRTELWSKFAFICAQAGVTAASRLPIGEIRAVPETLALFEAVADEAWRVGRTEGIALPDDLVARHVALARNLQADARSSLSDDLHAGRRMELEALLGELVRRAERVGEPAPVSRVLYGLLRPWQLRNEPETSGGAHEG